MLYVCICSMGTEKQRQERLSLLAEKWKKNQKDGIAEVVNRKLMDDFMIQVWFLGHQTRQDYLLVLSSLDFRNES